VDFDAKVFRLFNKGWPPNRVIAKYGHADRVIKLWEEYRQIMQDDYCRALEKLGEYGFQADLDSKYPLSDQVDQLGGEHWTLLKRESGFGAWLKAQD
jgi:hypothetical protein